MVDWAADPFAYLLPAEAGLARSVTSGVSQRAQYLEELETLEATSVDFYAALRELYRQYRATEIRDGAPPPAMEIPDFDFDDDFYDDFDEDFDEEVIRGRARHAAHLAEAEAIAHEHLHLSTLLRGRRSRCGRLDIRDGRATGRRRRRSGG